MIRTILYATDLGLYAPYVLQHAVSLAQAYKAELYVVHAVEPMGLFAESVLQTYLDKDTLERLRTDGLDVVMSNIQQRVLEGFRDEMGEAYGTLDLIRTVRVIQGDPPQVILEQARELAVDAVVLGAHSQDNCSGTFLGRTATCVMQLAEVPVYLVPMLQKRARADF